MSTFDDKQVMVTLAALAYVAPVPDPDHPGKLRPVKEEQEYMFGELMIALSDPRLATQGQWTVTWLGLSASQGEFAFIAEHDSEDKIVVAVRGTIFGPTLDAVCSDLSDDLRVGKLVKFTVGEHNVEISEGASLAFDGLTLATFDVPHQALSAKTLLEAVQASVGSRPTTIYVTGHSLGGSASTMVALYLHEALPDCTFQVYTFAAPTAGHESFAELFDATFGGGGVDANSSWRFYNRWDAIPNAWETLGNLGGFYGDPGPHMDPTIAVAVAGLIELPKGQYIQPKVNPMALNAPDYGQAPGLWDHDSTADTEKAFMGQVMFQHSVVNAYMPLVGAPPLPDTSTATAGASKTVTLAEPGFVHTLRVPAS